jgi:M6 family metalloprotease-like protein
MATIPTAVILCYRPMVDQTKLRDPGWYNRYFFDLGNTQASYWMEQTRGNDTISGTIFGWFPYPEDPNRKKGQEGYLQLRRDILEVATTIAFPTEEELKQFDKFVVMLALNPGEEADGNTGRFKSFGTWRYGMVAHVHVDKDPDDECAFDYIAHELGHLLGIADSWGPTGGYGHPYCVMSARTYGGMSTTYTPDPLPDGAAQYGQIPPRLNAAACVAKNYMVPIEHDIRTIASPTLVRIYARDVWFSRSENKFHALRVTSGERTFVFEYRRKSGNYERGMTADTIILSALEGGRGGLAGTFVEALTLPYKNKRHIYIPLTSFAVEIFEWSLNSESIVLRLSPNFNTLSYHFSLRAGDPETVQVREIANGIHDFVAGEVKCIRGPYPWRLEAIWQKQKVVLKYAVPIPAKPQWIIKDTPLNDSSGTVTLRSHPCVVAPPIPNGLRTLRDVVLRYSITENSGQSLLTIENNPDDGEFECQIACKIGNDLGSFSESVTLFFSGLDVKYENGFNEDRFRCLSIPHDDRIHFKSPILPSGIWDKIKRPDRPIVRKLLRSLAVASETDVDAFEGIERELASFLRLEHLPLLWIDNARAENIQSTSHLQSQDSNFNANDTTKR